MRFLLIPKMAPDQWRMLWVLALGLREVMAYRSSGGPRSSALLDRAPSTVTSCTSSPERLLRRETPRADLVLARWDSETSLVRVKFLDSTAQNPNKPVGPSRAIDYVSTSHHRTHR